MMQLTSKYGADLFNRIRETMLENCFIFPGWKSLHATATQDLFSGQIVVQDLYEVLSYVCELLTDPENDGVLASVLGCKPEHIARSRNLRRSEQTLIYKWDLIESDEGFKCLEVDLGADLGGMNQTLVHGLLDSHDSLGFGLCPGTAFMSKIRKKLDRINAHGTVCLLDSPEFFESYKKYYEPISRYFEQLLGRRCIYASIDQLNFGDVVTYDGEIVQSFLEITCFKDLLQESNDLAKQYEQAVSSKKVVSLIDSFCGFLAEKGLFAFLHDLVKTNRLPPKLASTVRAHIPETLFITRDNKDLIAQFKDEWIIKHTEGMGGNAVFAGWVTETEQWTAAIESALESRLWIAQRRVIGKTYSSVICNTDGECSDIVGSRILALFGLERELIGGHIRAGSGAVINATSGAGIGVMRFSNE